MGWRSRHVVTFGTWSPVARGWIDRCIDRCITARHSASQALLVVAGMPAVCILPLRHLCPSNSVLNLVCCCHPCCPGNSAEDACAVSPANLPEVLAVGGSNMESKFNTSGEGGKEYLYKW